MNVKMMHRLGRALVCLLLVCCILFNCSTVKVHALDPVTTFCLVVAVEAVLSSLITLGIQKGAEMTVQNELAHQIVEDMTNAGVFVVNGMVQAMIVQTGTTYKSYLPYEFIEWVRNWCYENEVITEMQSSGSSISTGTKVSYGTSGNWYYCNAPTILHKATYVNTSGSDRVIFVSYTKNVSFRYTLSSGPTYDAAKKTIGGVTYYYTGAGLPRSSATSNDLAGTFHLGSATYEDGSAELYEAVLTASGAVVSPVSTTYDLTLGDVALSDEEIKDRYAEWSANAQEVEDEETGTTTTYYPVSLPDTTDQTQAQTQTEAQAGTISEELAESLTGSLEEVFDGTVAATPWATFTNWLSTAISNPVEAAAELVISAIRSIFVPETDFLTAKVEAIRAEFSFADSIITTSEFFNTSLADLGTEPPIIYIDLGATEGSYDIGGKIVFMDLSWYERYKATGDAILSAFLWLIFAWRIILKLPGIISGMPGDWVMGSMLEIGVADKLPHRNGSYERLREWNREALRSKGPRVKK